ncbi:hypothetical protein [Streptosporangium roseum]|uniref:hypothetical protein n=1 Tax=Streptosporangium roseum TaxID=2001 RepID=UPI003431943B
MLLGGPAPGRPRAHHAPADFARPTGAAGTDHHDRTLRRPATAKAAAADTRKAITRLETDNAALRQAQTAVQDSRE